MADRDSVEIAANRRAPSIVDQQTSSRNPDPATEEEDHTAEPDALTFSLYEEILSRDPDENTLLAIETTYRAIQKFALRQYRCEYNRKDIEHAKVIFFSANYAFP